MWKWERCIANLPVCFLMRGKGCQTVNWGLWLFNGVVEFEGQFLVGMWWECWKSYEDNLRSLLKLKILTIFHEIIKKFKENNFFRKRTKFYKFCENCQATIFNNFQFFTTLNSFSTDSFSISPILSPKLFFFLVRIFVSKRLFMSLFFLPHHRHSQLINCSRPKKSY